MIPIHKLCSKILKAVSEGNEVYAHIFFERYNIPISVLAHAVILLRNRKLIKYEHFKIKEYK